MAFFLRHLPVERNASPHTIAAYRDTFKLLLRFIAESTPHTVTLQVEDLDPDRTLQFQTALETTPQSRLRGRLRAVPVEAGAVAEHQGARPGTYAADTRDQPGSNGGRTQSLLTRLEQLFRLL